MANNDKVWVGVLLGSPSDKEVMQACWETLSELKIPYEVVIASAHRTPEWVKEYAASAAEKGIKVLIAAAGGAAHLAGSVASWTALPVIGIPLEVGSLGGLDALLSTVQMPPGVPVATVSVGSWGAKNAALLAARILALSDSRLSSRLDQFYTAMRNKILKSGTIIKESFS